MSNYIHPMQQIYNQKVSAISESLPNENIDYDTFIKILRKHHIKFYSKDDLSKLTKLHSPAHTINVSNAFVHLQLIYVQACLDQKFFVVKFRGKTMPVLLFKSFEARKGPHMHAIDICSLYFKERMSNIYGKPVFWFRALGGIVGTHFIKRDVLERKIEKLFTNTCHSSCIERFILYVSEETGPNHISWAYLYKQVSSSPSEITALLNEKSSPEKTGKKRDIDGLSGMKIRTFDIESLNLPSLQMSHSQQFRVVSDGVPLKDRRRRLKSIINQAKQAQTLDDIREDLRISLTGPKDELIHSKSNVKHRLGLIARRKSSMSHY